MVQLTDVKLVSSYAFLIFILQNTVMQSSNYSEEQQELCSFANQRTRNHSTGTYILHVHGMYMLCVMWLYLFRHVGTCVHRYMWRPRLMVSALITLVY